MLWHIGVVGIVASRVLREFYRPTLVLGGDAEQWRGSGRSIEGFDLAAALRECDDLLVRHGGHAMAAGLSDATKPLLRLAACDVVKPLTDAALIAPTCAGERLASCALLKVPSNLSPMRAIWSVARLKEVVVDIGGTKSIASRMMPHA